MSIFDTVSRMLSSKATPMAKPVLPKQYRKKEIIPKVGEAAQKIIQDAKVHAQSIIFQAQDDLSNYQECI